MSTPPSASGTIAAGSNMEEAIQDACYSLRRMFAPEDDDGQIKKSLNHAWNIVHDALSKGGSKLKGRLRDKSEFIAYVTPGSDKERELIELLGSMAKKEVPWGDLFKDGTLLSSLWRQAH